jgi:gas vesicle structural protein
MSQSVSGEREVTLLDLLDRILNKGVILWGDVTLSVADVDLVYLGLKVLLTSVEGAERMRHSEGAGHPTTSDEDQGWVVWR